MKNYDPLRQTEAEYCMPCSLITSHYFLSMKWCFVNLWWLINKDYQQDLITFSIESPEMLHTKSGDD